MPLNSFERSRRAMSEGARQLAGGASSNFRLGVSPTPLVIERGEGPYVVASAGQDELAGSNTDILGWNDLDAVVARLEQKDVAAVIMEPAMCNSSVIAPRAGYLEGVRDACTRTGTMLIFDEVITGFRLGIGGAQGHFGVTPDLCTMGKALANGFPVAAVAG